MFDFLDMLDVSLLCDTAPVLYSGKKTVVVARNSLAVGYLKLESICMVGD